MTTPCQFHVDRPAFAPAPIHRGKLQCGRVKVFITLAALAAVALIAAPEGGATPPAHFVDQVNETSIDESCGFPVTVHLEGTSRFTVFFDADGNLVRTLNVFPALTFSVSANGKTLSTASPAIDSDTVNADGTVNVFIAGLLAHFSVPGQGIVAINTGLRIYLFTADGPNLVRQAGISTFDTFEGPILQLCDALAA